MLQARFEPGHDDRLKGWCDVYLICSTEVEILQGDSTKLKLSSLSNPDRIKHLIQQIYTDTILAILMAYGPTPSNTMQILIEFN